MTVMNTILSMYEGAAFPMPAIRGREDKAFIYTKDGETKSIIVTYIVDQAWNETLDIQIPQRQMEDIISLEDLFAVPVVIAVEFKDRHVWCHVSKIYMREKLYGQGKGDSIYHDGFAFVEKELLKTLMKV